MSSEFLQLRAHHGMCLAFFEGKGYSEGFTSHMQAVLDGMRENPMLELVTEHDIVCGECPNLQYGLCNTPALVLEFDRQVLLRCGLEAYSHISWEDFSKLVSERILAPGCREEICGNCTWNELCKSREHSPNF